MSWRTVIINGRSKLDYRMGYLVVRGDELKRVFIEEIAILVIENPTISLTGSLINALTERKVKVIFCDEKHNPHSELVPHHGSHESSLRIKAQMRWKDETKALVWQRIMREKIRNQSDFLCELGRERETALLRGYIEQIMPGDATNREGHAAKVYFNALFGMDFTRGQECSTNAALNYGYSILLSTVNREICAAGYLTQLGVFHDNQFNHFNLSCDLMEPFRPLVDRAVYSMEGDDFSNVKKYHLWNILNDTVVVEHTQQTVLNAIHISVRSVLSALNDDAPEGIRYYKLK